MGEGRCCFGFFDLRRGAFIIGVSLLVLHGVIFVGEIVATSELLYSTDSWRDQDQEPAASHDQDPGTSQGQSTSREEASTFFSGSDNPTTGPDVVHEVDPGALAARWACIIIFIIILKIHLLFNSLLVIGARTSRRRLVLVWLIYHGLACSLQTLGLVASLVAACIAGTVWVVVLVLVAMAMVAVMWYWFAVGVRFNRELLESGSLVYQEQRDEPDEAL